MKKQSLYLVIFLFFSLNQVLAQNAVSDSIFYRAASNNIILLYTDSVNENLRLYNGTEFTSAYRSSAGHPFFEYPEPQRGDVFYDGNYYPGVLLSYDLLYDEIIFITPDKNLNLKLITQKVQWFTIKNHFFVYLTENDSIVSFPGRGFYELIYEGDDSVFKKMKKVMYQPSKADEISKFILLTEYFVRKDNVYFPVDSKRSLLMVCRDQKNLVAKFMQKENLNFKKDPAYTIINVIEYYTKLKN